MIRRRSAAIEAIVDLAEYIGRDSLAAAERFIDAVTQTFKQLEEMPGLGHVHESDDPMLAGVRVWSVKGFRNHLIFYRPIEGGIEVLHVLHGARDLDAVLHEEIDPEPPS